MSAGGLAITRLVLDAVAERGAAREVAQLLQGKQLRMLTLDPDESRLCTRLWLSGWPSDLASIAAVASRRGWTLVERGNELTGLDVDFEFVHLDCAALLLQMVASRQISFADADRYLLRMRTLAPDLPTLEGRR